MSTTPEIGVRMALGGDQGAVAQALQCAGVDGGERARASSRFGTGVRPRSAQFDPVPPAPLSQPRNIGYNL